MKKNSLTSRREFIQVMGKGAIAGMVASPILSFLGCATSSPKTIASSAPSLLQPIQPSSADTFILSPSLRHSELIRWNNPINAAGEKFGFNNDYLDFIPVKPGNFDDMLLWVNHEYPHPILQNGYDGSSAKTKAQVEIEMDSIGGSIVRIKRNAAGEFDWVKNDPLNRRVHARTKIPFAGGISIAGKREALGTLSNCAGGLTPWRTFLTCEENYDLFYGERILGRKYATYERAKFEWYRYYDLPPEHYGWVVEVDPFSGAAKKLVSMGRFAHEGATIKLAKDGRPVAYMGDDVNAGCIYKFISDRPGSLEKGTLYVANTQEGRWIPLDRKKNPKLVNNYKSQLDVMIDARYAAVVAGGTPLDRPEDIEISPITGDIVIALTNNYPKEVYFGSLLKISEKNNDPLALEFEAQNLISGGLESGFACPDNLEFDQNGNLWFTTDMSDEEMNKGRYAPFKNNGLFVVMMNGSQAGKPQQIASGPTDAELTGLKFTPDYKSLFISVQHPGAQTKDLKNPTSHWPDGGDSLPAPAVVQISGEALEKIARRKS